jgi:hypothetical protein
MNEEIKDLLSEEIKAEINDLSTLEAGSKEKSAAIEESIAETVDMTEKVLKHRVTYIFCKLK